MVQPLSLSSFAVVQLSQLVVALGDDLAVIDAPGDDLAVIEDGCELAIVDPTSNVASELNCLCQRHMIPTIKFLI